MTDLPLSETPPEAAGRGRARLRPGADPTPLARWLVILAWSSGPAAAYALLGLLHALVQQALSVEVGFGRSLAFWVAALYLALPLWGFLPRRPSGWYARRPAAPLALLVGLLGAIVCGGFAVAWLARHGTASVAIPVLGSIAVLVVLGALTLGLAGRADDDT